MDSRNHRVFHSNSKWAFVLFLLVSAGAHAESPPLWVSTASFGGSGADSGTAVKVDQGGNRYVTGYFSSTANFAGKVLTSAGGTDILLAKFGSSGKLAWLVQAGGSGDDAGADLAFDQAGNIYLSGWFTDSASFRSVNGAVQAVTGLGESIFLAKYSPTGRLEWLQTGTPSFFSLNEGFGVAVEPVTETVYITGRAQGDTKFSSSNGIDYTVPGPGTWHMFLVKYDTDGNFQWGEWNQASPNSVAHKVAVDAANNAYVTGWLESTTTFHSQDGHDQTVVGLSGPVQTAPDYPDDAYIAKYDSSGNLKWVNEVGGYKAIANEVAVSRDGKVSITGFIGNINYGTPDQAQTIVTSQAGGTSINLGGGQFTNPYNKDVFIATYDASGVLIGASRIGEVHDDGGSGIAYDDDGNLYVAGVFQGTINVAGQVLKGQKTYNLFVLNYGPSGLAWAKKADGAGTEAFEGDPRLGLTPGGGVLVTGPYRGTALFDAFALNSTGAEDIFLAELSAGPTVTLSPTRLSFGSQTVGTTSLPQTVTLTNRGNRTLNITNIAISGDFAQSNTCSQSVAAGASCAFSITFTPTAVGQRAGALTIMDDAPGSPHGVSLSGTGRTGTIPVPLVVTVLANPSVLWPPNHKKVPVTVSGTITDGRSGVDPNSVMFAVADEYQVVQPSGSVRLLPGGKYSFVILLEASRQGGDRNGRRYTIVVSARDQAGTPGSSSAIVTVPHDQGH